MTDTVARPRKKPNRPPIEAEVRLEDWGPRGATTAQFDDRRILVDLGIPGETVIASVDRRRKPWHGVVSAVLQPSPTRIDAPCPYLALGCGGCQLQHLSYAAQLETKKALVFRELRSSGIEIGDTSIWPMEHPWRYRHTAAIAIGWEAGFRPRGRRGIVEVRDCPISHPLIGRFADSLNDLLRAGCLPNYHGKVWIDCTVVGSRAAPSLQTVVQGIEGLTLEAHPELPAVARALSSISEVSSVAFRHRSGEVLPLDGELLSTIEVAGRPMYLPAGSFFQTNLFMLEQLLARMRQVVTPLAPGEAADVYGGVGTFGLALADLTDHMTLIELDAAAVDAARHTAESWGLQNVDFVSRHAERALPEMHALDVVIVDPPRSGLGDIVVDALIANGASTIMYVSCSPQSLARDLARLVQSNYHVASLELFDFYPQTYHVESLAVLTR